MRRPVSLRPVSFRINGERLVLLGWSRAILLQLAHPLIAAGVYDHSGFRASPLAAARRLHATTHAMLAITFGSDTRRRAAIDIIRGIHTRVNGLLADPTGPFPAGTRYSAEDPRLVLWVHATLIESMILAYERFVGRLTPAERDEYCDASAFLAIELGAHDAEVPRTWAGVEAYLDAMYRSGVIVVGRQARELAAALLAGPLPRLLPPAASLNRLVTAGLMPPALREQYGLAFDSPDERRLERVSRALRAVRRATPSLVARWSARR